MNQPGQPEPPSPAQPPAGQQPQPPSKRKHGCLSAFGLVVLVGLGGFVVLIIVVAALVGSDDDTTSDGDSPAAESSGDDVYAVGETADTSGMGVTVHEVVDPWTSSNEFEIPQAGHRFVAVEATISNTSDEMETWSSVLGAEVTDSQSQAWDIALAGTDLPSLDGDIPAGGDRRGWVVFEVAEDATGLTMRIQGSLTATGAVFDLAS